MQPPMLEYQIARRPPSSLRPFLLVFLFGPLTGALVGFMQVAAVVLWWLHLGQPDFFYRGWQGAELFCILETISGSAVGAAYGFALWKFEKHARRRVRF